MQRRTLYILIAAGGSAALLLGALAFQHLGGLAPCKLCLWQRWPHAAAVVLGAAALVRPGAALPALGGCAALTTAGLGLYHAGVEQAWWPGPAGCTGGGAGLSGLSGAELLNPESAPAIVMCDEVPWQMLGVSMAGWNALVSLALAALWLIAARRG
ncbi:disulfide bond formation protein B [Roseovarius salinarum]|uniref:disulfide bond formation protein B n=1 Tax=Roseovarius salinarum TaxID=1981892 RepID=UPI000C320AB1|nr:disulfide bond formation protein B [Roseovarius salinarum]